ncbi:chloride channel core [Streptomyces spongiicola]|uniref:Chloride channel core n=1 Tax=Streptomyces spongiicola TaxID=1690221 RepID=A0ABN5KPC5_9ACTN|nr:chloride channel protein [Streptomyces spongiicola]AWK12033.1 chloride channel core [Streptomyces spongiicola]
MTQPQAGPEQGDSAPGSPRPEPDELRSLLLSTSYRRILLFSALIGVPISLIAFWFLVALHQLEHLMWDHLPRTLLGGPDPPWWWPLVLLPLAGLIVGLVVVRLPGAGGHVPAYGLQPGGASPRALPGVVVAAAASLPLGAALGPEAPLIALGGGLALLFRDLARSGTTPQNTALLGAAGAGAAIAVVLGNPVIAAVLLMEIIGVGGPRLVAVMLPALLSSGVGSLVFTGFGRWTGLQTGSLRLPVSGPFPHLDAGDVGWTLLVGAVVGVLVHTIQVGGRLAAGLVRTRPVPFTVLCALGAGACAALYTGVTGRTPADVASSGEGTMARLASDPASWGVGALLAVLVFKGIAYALCLGSLRGGPIFPALFLGAATGVLLAPLPGFGVIPGMAAGMAASAGAALRLPVSSVVLVALLLGSIDMTPVVILAAVVAIVTTELLPGAHGAPPPESAPAAPAGAGAARGAP